MSRLKCGTIRGELLNSAGIMSKPEVSPPSSLEEKRSCIPKQIQTVLISELSDEVRRR